MRNTKVNFDDVKSLPEMFFAQANIHLEKPFLWSKQNGKWHFLTWDEVARRARNLANGLKEIGVKPGERVMLVSENRPEWLIADIAIMSIGAITVPAYTTNTVASHVHIISDSDAKVALLSTAALAKNLLPAAQEAGLNHVITIEPPIDPPQQSVKISSWADIEEIGHASTNNLDVDLAKLKRDGLCCIIYTSGTGGTPTGVMLSHGAIICNTMGAEDLLSELPNYNQETEVFLSFLPLSHSYEHTAGQFVPISIGAEIYYAESVDKLVGNIGEVKPTIMTAVPRLYETIRGKVLRGAEQSGGLKEKLLHKAILLGTKKYEDPASLSFSEKLFNMLLTKLVRQKVGQRFGGRLKAFVSGGAPLNYEVGIFFIALNVRILQGYGQTESAPVVSANRAGLNKLHTVGPPLKGVECKIAADGEILIRGELVMDGYWNKPERTSITIVDGWLHTGDIGLLDDDGYIQITDRKKDIIVNSGGDNISPQRVEGILCVEAEIAQAMVYGDQKPNLVALLVPDVDFVADWRKSNNKPKDIDLTTDADFAKVIRSVLDRVNAKLSVIEKIRKAIVVSDPFTIENEMLTPSLKIRRHIIKENFGESLEKLYR